MAFVSGVSLGTSRLAGRAVSVRRAKSSVTMMMEPTMSKSIPFLECPKNLDGTLPGDVGFDPLYLSDNINLKYARASELKHGRICMLAVLGIVVQEIIHLPGPYFSESNPIAAIYKIPVEGWFQIIAFICAVELATFKRNYDGSPPGNYEFDPLKLAKDDQTFKKYEENEIVHCRAAMVGWFGFFAQQLVTGQNVLEQLGHMKPLM
ncbi:hypothetical protein NDN08_006394 [Rhodosorus marinus]|uniref:Chlorophyll a-b binding protein, chloroplastic n=1 Tax=Rhodosorus marinus TaxID=101924 RepID=A0AAV8UKL1_9RHOD|nr:hypothetical protein NDN08_006394 [Rhodosorus marinus]